jgi:multidrug efflux pump subunit AcrA (membrane-fusion protein)
MKKIKLHKETVKQLLELKKSRRVTLEGNILKLIDAEHDAEFNKYLQDAIEEGKTKQRQRLDITKKIQTQNKELLESQQEKDELMSQLESALTQAESAKNEALNDLDVLQRKTQFKLIQTIVRIALAIIIGVGVCTTVLYIYSITLDRDTELIGNTWSNMFGILLTNAFSIIGTIMGVKYASKDSAD